MAASESRERAIRRGLTPLRAMVTGFGRVLASPVMLLLVHLVGFAVAAPAAWLVARSLELRSLQRN